MIWDVYDSVEKKLHALFTPVFGKPQYFKIDPETLQGEKAWEASGPSLVFEAFNKVNSDLFFAGYAMPASYYQSVLALISEDGVINWSKYGYISGATDFYPQYYNFYQDKVLLSQLVYDYPTAGEASAVISQYKKDGTKIFDKIIDPDVSSEPRAIFNPPNDIILTFNTNGYRRIVGVFDINTFTLKNCVELSYPSPWSYPIPWQLAVDDDGNIYVLDEVQGPHMQSGYYALVCLNPDLTFKWAEILQLPIYTIPTQMFFSYYGRLFILSYDEMRGHIIILNRFEGAFYGFTTIAIPLYAFIYHMVRHETDLYGVGWWTERIEDGVMIGKALLVKLNEEVGGELLGVVDVKDSFPFVSLHMFPSLMRIDPIEVTLASYTPTIQDVTVSWADLPITITSKTLKKRLIAPLPY